MEEALTELKTKLKDGSSVDAVVDPASANRQKHVVNYAIEPDRSTQILADCIADEHCHIKHFHTCKTGGTTVESHFRKIFPSNKVKCCDDDNREVFYANVEAECDKPFNSYAKSGAFLSGVAVPKCLDYYKTIGHRLVLMVPFRSPVERSLSAIHQVCNKHPGKFGEEFKEKCERCDYDADKEFWMRLATRTNTEYEDQMYKEVTVGTSEYGIPTITIDTGDISAFFDTVQEKLPDKFASRMVEEGAPEFRTNPEEVGTCDFGVHSDIMKALSPALAVYRNMTLGW